MRRDDRRGASGPASARARARAAPALAAAVAAALGAAPGEARAQALPRTLEGGLVVEDVKLGRGREALNQTTVRVHYTGTLDDGTEFDSSRPRGQPFEFTLGLGQVIRGWDLGVLGMKEGGERRLTIPSELGYGAAGAGASIPPNATLHFDVELIEVLAPPFEALDADGLSRARRGGAVIVDLRTHSAARATGIIPGSVVVPVFSEAGAPDPAFRQAIARSAPTSKRIVLVHDDPQVSAQLARLMSPHWEKVDHLADGISAWEADGRRLDRYDPLAEAGRGRRRRRPWGRAGGRGSSPWSASAAPSPASTPTRPPAPPRSRGWPPPRCCPRARAPRAA